MTERLEKRTNGNLLKLLTIAVLISYIGVKDVVAPLIREVTGKQTTNVLVSEYAEKIVRMDEAVRKMDRLPEIVSAQAEAIIGLKTAVERLEKKIDEHVSIRR
jgi:tetrahydromethanopterin S-methyltransferase subunit C